MNTILKTAFAATALVASLAASAQGFAPSDTRAVDARQARQEARIQQGVARGEINRREARTLRQGQREIARFEMHAKADGFVSRDEMRRLTAMLDRADAQIRQARRHA